MARARRFDACRRIVMHATLRRTTPDAAIVPRIRRRRRSFRSSRQNWQREWPMTPEDRLPPEILEGADKIGIRTLGVPEEFGGVELDKATEVQTFAHHRRGDRARRFRARRQAGAELEGLGAAAQPRAAASAGEVVQAPGRRPAVPAGALPDRAARRLRPLAALQRAGSRDADPRRQGRRRLGHQRPQAVHLQRLRRRPLRRLCQHQPEGRHAAGHVERSWCRATRRGSPSRAATRRSAAAS